MSFSYWRFDRSCSFKSKHNEYAQPRRRTRYRGMGVSRGIGAQWLGVSSTGSIFALLPILIFCVVFGISMDYEVMMLSRIMENYERTGDNEFSTAEGLESTGGLITSALILAVVVGAFVFTDNEVMKAIGLGLTAHSAGCHRDSGRLCLRL